MFRHSLFGLSLFRWLIIVVAGLGLVILSFIIRDQLNIEWNLQSFRDFVQGLGKWGPLAYVGILTFRFIFLIPSGLLLLSGGILFGAMEGSIYASIGLIGSGLLKYGFALAVGRATLLRQLPDLFRAWVEKMATKKMSAWALVGVGAYPFIPKHVFQLVAILSGMSFPAYFSAIIAGSTVRAAIFANFGEAIYSGSGMILATAIIIFGLSLPLCITPWRRWLLGPFNFNSKLQLKSNPET